MSSTSILKTQASGAIIGFETKPWLAAHKLRDSIDAPYPSPRGFRHNQLSVSSIAGITNLGNK